MAKTLELPRPGAPYRIILADDEPDLRFVMRMMLEEDPRFEIVGEADNGAEAIALAETMNPDLVVIDLHMPQIDGLTAIPRIRAAAPDSKIVVTSGSAPEWTPASTDPAVDLYLEKPDVVLLIRDELADLLEPAARPLHDPR